jgi:hypothetical protein
LLLALNSGFIPSLPLRDPLCMRLNTCEPAA